MKRSDEARQALVLGPARVGTVSKLPSTTRGGVEAAFQINQVLCRKPSAAVSSDTDDSNHDRHPDTPEVALPFVTVVCDVWKVIGRF